MQHKPNAKALLPIVIFLVLYLGSGIYFEYINPMKGQMGFYIMSVVVAFGDRKSTRLNSSHPTTSRMPSSA